MSHDVSSLIVVDAAEEDFLDLILAVNYTLHLYSNDVLAGLTQDQVEALDETDFTEATFPGYASVALTGGSWTTTQGDPSTGAYAEQSFTRSSTGTAENIWGYYVTRTSDGALQWFEQFDGPIVVENSGDQIDITPRMTLDDVEGNDVQTGTITMFGGSSAPTGWLLCDGSAVSRTTFADLFAEVGTAFGAGDGSTTFNLPDLRQRFPLGVAASGTGSTLGGTGGTIDHTHALDSASSGAKITVATSGNPVRIERKNVGSYDTTVEVTTSLSTTASGSTVTTGATLVGSSGSANPPFQAVNFIIKS